MDCGPRCYRCIFFPIVSAVFLLRTIHTKSSFMFKDFSYGTSLMSVTPYGIQKVGIGRKEVHQFSLKYSHLLQTLNFLMLCLDEVFNMALLNI